MPSTLFLQSDVSDPYLIYKSMLDKNPVYWDETNQIWAIYSYQYCVEIIQNTKAQIPVINPDNEQKLNKYALEILNNLARLSNGISHQVAREIAVFLFSNMKNIEADKVISQLIKDDLIENKIDWVNSVCKKLPVLILLESFNFEEKDTDFISEKIESLVKIMLPKKTEEQIKLINGISEEMYSIVEKQLDSLHFFENTVYNIAVSELLSPNEIKTICVSNLIGLFIQSYDAGRGILSNSLLQIIQNKNITDKIQIEKSVIETLRFDPPIHNTKRIATEDILINGNLIKKNDSIFIVLASANRDQDKFENASLFDIERNNNTENLTFGMGGHMCLAKHFSIYIATEALYFLFNQNETITLLENNIQYEPMINARLPKNIWISLQ
jgi:cytochrome P450